jgi:2-methylisocitrate lyase-like PEP mutase family enzyme
MANAQTAEIQSRCDLLRSLQRPGAPLLLPNAWDVATARAVVAAGFPVVATTSGRGDGSGFSYFDTYPSAGVTLQVRRAPAS